MPTITFYRQGRRDGGQRTGIEIDQDPVFGVLEGVTDEFDPVLTWYVDIECSGDALPDQPDAVRGWLLANAADFRRDLVSLAEEIAPGLDVDSWPLRREFPGPDGMATTIRCAAQRRSEAHEIVRYLSDLAKHWEEIISDLPATEAIAR